MTSSQRKEQQALMMRVRAVRRTDGLTVEAAVWLIHFYCCDTNSVSLCSARFLSSVNMKHQVIFRGTDARSRTWTDTDTRSKHAHTRAQHCWECDAHTCNVHTRERMHTRAHAPHPLLFPIPPQQSYLQTCPSCRMWSTVWKTHMHTVQHLRGEPTLPAVAGGVEDV